MAIALSDSIFVQTAKPADDKYGPWKGATLTDAKNAALNASQFGEFTLFDPSFRYQGLTIGLLYGANQSYGAVEEWWFKDGILDNQLVQKTGSSSGGSIEIFQTGTSLSTDVRSIDVNQGKGNGLITQIKALTNSGSSTAADFTATTGITLNFDPTSATGTPQGIVGGLATTTNSANGTGAILSVNVDGGTVKSVRIEEDPNGGYVNGDNLIIAANSIGISPFGTTDTLIKLDTADFDSDGYISKEKVILNTLFDSQLAANTVTGTVAVGGVSPATPITSFSGDSVIDVLNKILFPTQDPKYAPATLTTTASNLVSIYEVGDFISPTIISTGTIFDGGDMTNSIIYRNTTADALLTTPLPPLTLTTAFPNSAPATQFGFLTPNGGTTGGGVSDRFSLSTPVSSYQIPGVGSTYRSTTQFRSQINSAIGQPRKDSTGVDDTRPFAATANNPQPARTITSSPVTSYGYIPWIYKYYTTPQPNPAAGVLFGNNLATANKFKTDWIAGEMVSKTSGTANPGSTYGAYIINSALNSLSIITNSTLSIGASFFILAIPDFYAIKTKYDATPVGGTNNGGPIGLPGSQTSIELGGGGSWNGKITLDSVNDNNNVPFWSGVDFQLYITPVSVGFPSVNLSIINS